MTTIYFLTLLCYIIAGVLCIISERISNHWRVYNLRQVLGIIFVGAIPGIATIILLTFICVGIAYNIVIATDNLPSLDRIRSYFRK